MHSEWELLQQVAAGSHPAFKALYDLHKQRVYFTAYKVLQSSAAAQDALQEIFIKVWVNREKLAGMDHFPAWLNTVIRNHLVDKLREHSTKERSLDFFLQEGFETYADTTYHETEFRELLVLVEQATRQLSPQQQKVFALSRLEGMKHREIADELGISTETVKKYIMDALQRIREFLRQHGKDVSVVLLLQLLQL